MLRLRLVCAAFITTALVVAACNGSGEHRTPDESEGTGGETSLDSAASGTVVPGSLPPEGTVNPAAPSGPGTYGDSAAPAAIGQTQGATPGSPNPANPVQSGVASDSSE
ncbi:MAG TPA: hypothetical protein VHG93_12565 [Longimicrobium sp.]|nr:hypothetical protein [Longimicrobium sp.]